MQVAAWNPCVSLEVRPPTTATALAVSGHPPYPPAPPMCVCLCDTGFMISEPYHQVPPNQDMNCMGFGLDRPGRVPVPLCYNWVFSKGECCPVPSRSQFHL